MEVKPPHMGINTEWILPFIAPHRTWWWPRLPRHRVGVCMLHSVGNRLDLPDCPSNNVLEPEKLRAVIGLLRAAGYVFTTFGTAFGGAKPERPCPARRRMVLTFDDGFADNFTNLFPHPTGIQCPRHVRISVCGDDGEAPPPSTPRRLPHPPADSAPGQDPAELYMLATRGKYKL